MLKNITKYNKLGRDNAFDEEEYSIFLKRIRLAYTRTKVGRPPKDVVSNPMDVVMNKVEEANKNVKEKEDGLKKSFNNFFSNSSAKKENEDKKPVSPPKPVTKPSFNANNLNNGQKPSMKPKTEGSKKMLNFVARINNMTSDEKVEIAHKISKINSEFNLTEKHYQFIKVMAEMGYYKVTDITDTDNATFSNAYKMKNSLVEAGLVQELEEINGATGRSFKPIMLSDLGNMAYVLRFKKNPYESTYIQLIREQKSPAHGLKIQQILEILIDAGYSCSQEDIKKTPSGRDTICDILARKQKTDFRIEYEEGNYNKEDYLDKFSRVWEVTPYLIVIVPNEEVKNKISPIVGELAARKFSGFNAMKKAGYQELVATIMQLKNNPDIITNLKKIKNKEEIYHG